MSRTPTVASEPVYDYLLSVGVREAEILRRLREETAALEQANMQIAPDQGAFMQILVAVTGARRYLEVGVFTGYSSLAVALALPPDGRITACDVSDEWTAVARRYWDEAGVADRIHLRLGPAVETLDALVADGEVGSYDLAFIDADKANYDAYYERALELLRPGGLIVIDNVLWGGRVADQAESDPDTQAIRALNEKVHADDRVTLAMLTVADGLTLAAKRG